MRGAVLVVEDDRELRELVRRYLERAGHAVHTTGSGAEAIGLLASGGVDLVVLDLGLPDVDGLEVLAAAHRDGRAGTPVVVLTARSRLEDRIDGLRRGADDYVTKPFSPTELVLRVRGGAAPHRAGAAPRSRGDVRRRPAAHRRGRATRRALDGRPLDLTPDRVGAADRAGRRAGPGVLPLRAGQPGARATSSPATSAPSTRT